MIRQSTEEVRNKSGEDLRVIEDIGNERPQFLDKIKGLNKIEEEKVRGNPTQKH